MKMNMKNYFYIIFCLVILMLLSIILDIWLFGNKGYFIQMQNYKYHSRIERSDVNRSNLNSCEPKLIGLQNITFENNLTWDEVYRRNVNVRRGGCWHPGNQCKVEEHVAIIMPYRDRETHLKQFLNYMHPFLQRQMLSYRIIVIEQKDPVIFNKASLMNIGFKIASQLEGNYSCFIFHDVDIFPESDLMKYSCLDNAVIHFPEFINKHNYSCPKFELTGGVITVKKHIFQMVNGYSNRYWGWGGEDKDFFHRLEANHCKIVRCENSTKCRYTMIKHQKDVTNPKNKGFKAMNQKAQDSKTDGFTNVNYTLHEIYEFKLFTWIYVSLAFNNYTHLAFDQGSQIFSDFATVTEKMEKTFKLYLI